MVFNCDVKIVDMMMGSGKSSAAINYINDSDDDERFLYITPLIDEVDRVIQACSGKNFVQPEQRYKTDTKTNNIKRLLNSRKNIVSTHALFKLFDQETIDLCRAGNYTLIMDEVADVVNEYFVTKNDYDNLLEKYVNIEEDTRILRWREDQGNYTGRFYPEKKLCEMECLADYGNTAMLYLFPISTFNAFRKIYILTYMFDAQIQRLYYDFYKVPYSHLYVDGKTPTEYHFTDVPQKKLCKYDMRKLIHICDHTKLNQIGDRETDLCMSWYKRNKDNYAMAKLKNNLLNFFCNISHAKTKDTLWTTYKEFKSELKGKGYSSGYLYHTARALNGYGDRHYVAYPINKYMQPCIKKFFESNGVSVDEDKYALSEMLQFIWRSAIRNGESITVYIPSIRMRTMFEEWISSISAEQP